MDEQPKPCSAGATMLIERMKTHPEEFRGEGRFTGVVRDVKTGATPTWISRRDVAALADAFDLMLEDLFTEHVLTTIVGGGKEEAEASPTKAPAYNNTAQAAYSQAVMEAHRAAMQQNALAGIGNRPPLGSYQADCAQNQRGLIARLFK